MTDTIRVFVNATAVDLATGARVEEAVAAYDPSLVTGLRSGAAYGPTLCGRRVQLLVECILTQNFEQAILKK